MEIQNGYSGTMWGTKAGTISAIVRITVFYLLVAYHAVYAVQYILAHGNVQGLWQMQAGFGVALLIFATLDFLCEVPSRHHLSRRKKELRDLYFYFLVGSLVVVALLWDHAFNKAALFTVITLGVAVGIHVKVFGGATTTPDEGDSGFPETISHTPSKRSLRRKKNKSKRK